MTGKSTYGGRFCESDEKEITSMGVGYVANFLSGEGVGKGGATLTNKRVYYSGKTISAAGKGLSITKEQKIVHLRDITGVGYSYYNPVYLVIYGILSAIASIICFVQGVEERLGTTHYDPIWIAPAVIALLITIIAIVIYMAKLKTLFLIEYAGGNIAFDVTWFTSHEQDTFIRNIHLLKDRVYGMTAVAQGFVKKSADDTDDEGEIPEL